MKKSLSLALGLVLSPCSFANADIDLIEQLFQSGKTVDAYELGLTLQATYEGSSKFDYYFGVSAIDAGDASQGVFALERVLQQAPDNMAARLELARGYFQLEEYARARQEFETVLAAKPPEAVSKKVNKYMDAIRLRESRYLNTAKGFFRIGAGSDSNANAATDESSITLDPASAIAIIQGNNVLAVPSASQAADSAFVDFATGMNFTIPVTSKFGLQGGASIDATVFNDDPASDVNTTQFNFHVGGQNRFGQHRLNYSLSHQAMLLADDFYRNISALSLSWNHSLNSRQQVRGYARLGQTEHVQSGASLRDIDSQIFGVSYLHQFAVRFDPVLIAGIQFGGDAPQTSTATTRSVLGRDITGFNVGGILTLNEKNAIRGSFNMQSSDYDGVNTAFNKTRNDDLTAIRLEHTLLLSQRWKLNSYFSTTDNSSNIALFEYDRNRFGINLSYETR